MPTNLTDVDTFTAPISVPAAGDNRTAASVETPLQGLANRTRNLKNRLDGIDAANHTWSGTNTFSASPVFSAGIATPGINLDHASNEYAYLTPRARTVMLPLPSGAADSADWRPYGDGRWLSVGPAATYVKVVVPIYLPNAATFTAVRIGVQNTTGAGIGVKATVYGAQANKTTPSSGSAVAVAGIALGGTTVGAASSAVIPLVLAGGGTEVVSNAGTSYHIAIEAGDPGLFLWWVEVQFTDPGPRNY